VDIFVALWRDIQQFFACVTAESHITASALFFQDAIPALQLLGRGY